MSKTPAIASVKEYFGTKGFSPSARPEVVFDWEVAVNVAMVGFLWPDGAQEIICTKDDKAFTKKQIARIEEITRAHCLIGFNCETYDNYIHSTAIQGYTPEDLKAISDDLIGRDLFHTKVAQNHKIKKPDYLETIDLMAATAEDTGPGNRVGLKKIAMAFGVKKITELPFDHTQRLTGELLRITRDEYLPRDLHMTRLLREHKAAEDALAARLRLMQIWPSLTRALSMQDSTLGEAIVAAGYAARVGDDEITAADMKRACRRASEGAAFTIEIPQFPGAHNPQIEAWRTDISESEFATQENGTAIATRELSRIIEVGGLCLQTGLGGIHSKDGPGVFKSSAAQKLVLIDVVSYYPSLITQFDIRPAGLTQAFCETVAELLALRIQAKRDGDKLTANALKVPLNAIFGKLGQPGSAVFDPRAKYAVTLLGQYLLAVLVQMLADAGLEPISANTDGVFAFIPAAGGDEALASVIDVWQDATGLALDREDVAIYARANCNNYACVFEDGSRKAKGADFSVESNFRKVGSNMIAARAAMASLLDGVPVRETVEACEDLDAFLMKVTKSEPVTVGGIEAGKIVRAYPSTDPNVPIILSAETKAGSRSQIFAGCRYVEELPDSLPADLDREVAIAEAAKTVAQIDVALDPVINDIARDLERAGFEIRVMRDGALDGTLADSKGADYSSAAIGVKLGAGNYQLVSEDIAERHGVPVLGVRSDDLALIRASGEVLAQIRREMAKKGAQGRAILSGSAVLVGGEFSFDAHSVQSTEIEFTQTRIAAPERDFSRVTNGEFMRAMFGQEGFAHANFVARAQPRDEDGDWGGTLAGLVSAQELENARANTYTSISLFDAARAGRVTRLKSHFVGLCAVMLDDIGTKARDPREMGFPDPSAIVETSPNNFQFVYFLDEPILEAARAEALVDALGAFEASGARVTDSGAGGINRLMRLPVGYNNKKTLDAPFSVRLVDYRPERRFNANAIARWVDCDLDVAQSRISIGDFGDVGFVCANDDGTVDHPLYDALADLGLIVKSNRIDEDGWLRIRCPWDSEHSVQSDTAGAKVIFSADGGYGFKCFHSHGETLKTRDLWRFLQVNGHSEVGPNARRRDAFAGFDYQRHAGTAVTLDEATGEVVDMGFTGDRPNGESEGGRELVAGNYDSIDSNYECTDLANAKRIQNQFGGQMFFSKSHWFIWQGTHWSKTDSGAFRRVCTLSSIIGLEIAALYDQDPTPDDLIKKMKTWAAKSEMAATIKSATTLAASLLYRDPNTLNVDSDLLNVRNGTVNLRTGHLRAHSPTDFITNRARASYLPGMRAPRFEQAITQIWPDPAVRAFMQRLFGYSLYGSISEHILAIHFGSGGNGKSLIVDLIQQIIGDYAATAMPKLLMETKNDRHSTEIAMLHGLRLVLCHESNDGDALAEGQVKQMTGGDMITARQMHQDPFTFAPTFTVHLLTNHKPVIRGSDDGIWRRVLLIPYPSKFGDEQEVREGRADFLKDRSLAAQIKSKERDGVLTWLIEGAIKYAKEGLNVPPSIRAATDSYQADQDRVGEFVRDCCEFFEYKHNGNKGTALRGPTGLMSAYNRWTIENNYKALGIARFKDGLERITKQKIVDGTFSDNRKASGIRGLRLKRGF